MAHIGRNVLDVGSTRIGQKYVLGAQVPLDNPNWKGPWDCAEFTSWVAYQAYDGMVFGAGQPKKLSHAEPYSGFWYEEAKKFATVISWQDALEIPGAVLIRAPSKKLIGHVAFSMGDGKRTLEARGKKFGVGIFDGAMGRPWGIGCLLPAVDYGEAGTDANPATEVATQLDLPKGFLWLKMPNFRGPDVVALQAALDKAGIDPGPIDGEFGPMTDAAVISFQVVEGLEVDGIVGPATAAALGLGFPIVGGASDQLKLEEANKPKGPAKVKLPQVTATFDGISEIVQEGKSFKAKTGSGHTFIIGSSVPFTDDMHRVGLFQGSSSIKDSLQFGVYKATDFTEAFGKWAHFIEPTLNAEGGARFATLNTYDRAAFTFGAPQLAAHTPNKNFIVYLRALLELVDADKHFPELSLRDNGAGKTTVHRTIPGGFENLEEEIEVLRPNNIKDTQLPKLMKFLNSSPVKIDESELSAAARLMNWLRLDQKARELQITVFIDQSKKNLNAAKTKVPAFDGTDWREALWIMDILHQGRGKYSEIKTALNSADRLAALKKIGAAKYPARIKSVASAIGVLNTSGILNGFEV